MDSLIRINPKLRLVFSKLGSLLLLFQRSPIVQIIFPEARVMGTKGAGELMKWSVATVAGLGAYDTVAGATTMTQIAPTPVVSPVTATTGVIFSMTVQVTGAPGNPGSWSISAGSLPPGIVKSNSGSTCTLSGVPTVAGSYPFTLKAWENSGNSGGSIAKAFTIRVAQGVVAPAITTNPVSATINPNSTATLTVAASGTSPTFQWYRGAKGVTTNPVTGATSATFTTPALTVNISYWARAANSAGTADSNAAVISIRVPPAITTQPQSNEIGVGGTTTLTVSASGTSPTFQWYVGNSGGTGSPITNATSVGYTPPALTTTTSYWVRVSNAAGTADSNTATLTVDVPPEITSQPLPQTIASGGTAALHLSATGTSLQYQWYVGNSGDLSNPITGAGGVSASFTTPPLAATASYWVKVGNLSGSLFSATITVTVATPPAITSQPASVAIESGTTTTLTASASGTSPAFQWYIGNSGDLSNPISVATGPTFTTPALTVETAYWVRATNAGGVANSNTAIVSIHPALGTLQDWSAARFTPAQLGDPAVSGPTADPDGDGITNEAEYVFGLTPLLPDIPPETVVAVSAGQFSIAFTAKAAGGDGYTGRTRHYALEAANDLANPAWAPVPGYEDIIAAGQGVSHSAASAGAKNFYHLKVWLTP